MAKLLKWLGNAVGTVADAIIPGDQSSWHQPDTAPAPPQRVNGPARSLPQMPGPSTMAGMPSYPNFTADMPKPATPPPTKPSDIIDYINNAAKIGPKEVAKPGTKPDAAAGGSLEQSNGVQGTLQAIGQIPVVGWPVQLGNEANAIADATAAGQNPNVLLEAAKTGVANSPLGAAAQLFGGVANTATQALGINQGTLAAEANPLFGETNSLPNQVRDQGLGRTVLNNAMNVAGAALPDALGTKMGPTVPEAATAVKAANARLGERGFIDPNAEIGPARVPELPVAPDGPMPPAPVAKQKTTRFAGTTVPESEKVSAPIREQVKANAPGYDVQTERAGLTEAARRINEMGPDASIAHVQRRLEAPNGKITRQDALDAEAVAAGLDARGGEVAARQATEIYTRLSEHLTAGGQLVQAAAMIARRSPQGLKFQAISDLRKAGVDITPELAAKIDAHISDITAAGKDRTARGKGVAGLSKTILKEIPQSKLKNLISVWKAGLLSGAKTQGGNFESNATFSLGHALSDPLAAVADKGFSLFTGQRTKTAGLSGRGAGFKEGVTKGVDTLKTGIDERKIGTDGKYEQHAEINFKNPVVQKVLGAPSNFVFRSMSAADQPFYYSQMRRSLNDLGKADGLNQGLKGKALKEHVDEFASNPTEEAMQTAVNEAQKAVLGNDTFASKIIAGAKQAIDRTPFTDAGKATAHAVIDILAPFTKVPSAFLSRVVDFTPIGPLKQVASQIAKKQFDQRAMSEALSEATTGTAALWLGTQLATGNLISGDYPKNDAKEAARWKAEHITANSVKVGDKWYSLNYFGPLGLLFNAAKSMKDSQDGGGDAGAGAAAAVAALGQGLMGQSFLQGFTGFSDAIKDPERNAKSFVNSEAGSVIPSWSNDLGNLTDRWQRQANSAWDAIKARIPGARNTLLPKTDTFGNDLEQAAGGETGGINAALNPLKPSLDNHTPLLDELDRLSEAKQAVFPVESKTIGSGDTSIKLTPEQVTDRTKRVGSKVDLLWNKIIESPGYAKLDDEHKKDALAHALSDVSGAVDRQMTAEIDSSKLTKAATGNVAQILMGRDPIADDYINAARRSAAKGDGTPGVAMPDGTVVGGSSADLNPAERYQAMVDKYEADKKAGRLSAVQDFDTRQTIAKASVTSKYSQDVLDLYGMSKNERNAFLDANPDQQGLMADVSKLSAELKNRNFTSTDKIAKQGAGKKGKKGKLPSFTAATHANAAVTKLLGGTGKAFKSGKVAVKKPKVAKVKKVRNLA